MCNALIISILAVSCGEFCGQPLCEDLNTRKETKSEVLDLPSQLEERLRLLQEPLEKGSTIIYVPTRKQTLKIASYLCKCGVKAAAYHAGVCHADCSYSFLQSSEGFS